MSDIFNQKFAELVETAREYRTECVVDEFKATSALLDLCYKIEYVADVRKWAESLNAPKPDNEHASAPKRDLSPEITAIKSMIADSPKQEQASIFEPQSSTKAKKVENAHFIDNSLNTYFDNDLLIEVYQRNVKRKDGTIYETYATLDKNGRRLDVSFASSFNIENVRGEYNTFLPCDYEVQNKNGYARLYIKSCYRIGGEPMRIEQ